MRRMGIVGVAVTTAAALAGCGTGSETSSTEETAASVATRSKPAAGQEETAEARHADATTGGGRGRETGKSSAARQPIQDPAGACAGLSGSDRKACELSYEICMLDAKKVVTAYYREEPGPDLDEYATRYAADEYGASGSSQEAAYTGCLGALFDEYTALYR